MLQAALSADGSLKALELWFHLTLSSLLLF